MKKNDQETIRHKLDQLDTLGGGIVFGREESWEKLQARMDKKPARKIALYYGVAAAVLLLVACLLFLFNKAEPQLAATTQNPKQLPLPAPVTHSAITTETPASMPEVQHVQKTIAKNTGQPTHAPLPQPVLTEAPKDLPTEERPAPAISLTSVSAAPMRIVHINELDKDAPPAVAVAAPAIAAEPMRVVTMSEVLRDDYPMRTEEIHHESSMPLVKVLFRQEQFNSRNTASTQNPFNIRINLQN